MKEAAESQSEVVSQNIQKESADFELLTEKQKRLVIKIRAMREKLAKEKNMITALRCVPSERY